MTDHVWVYGRGTDYPDGPIRVLGREGGWLFLEGRARAVRQSLTTASEREAWLRCAEARRTAGGRLVESAQRIEKEHRLTRTV